MQDSSTHITRKNPLKIIFLASDRSKGLGDNIIALDTLFVIKNIFEFHLVVLANATIARLLEGFGFYDELFLLAEKLDDERNVKLINSCHCDFLISGGCKRYQLKVLESTNARCIITHTKVYSLLRPRFKTIPTFIYRSLSYKDSSLLFLRRIDKRRFDSMIGTLDFTQAKMVITEEHRARIAEFLSKEFLGKKFVEKGILDSGALANHQNFGFFSQKARDFRDLAVCLMRAQKSATSYSMPRFFARFVKSAFAKSAPHTHQNIKTNQMPKQSAHADSASLPNIAPADATLANTQAMQTKTTQAISHATAQTTSQIISPAQNQPKFLVLANPFCLTADKNLTPNGWLKLIDKISQKGCFIPVVATYEKVHDEFVKSLESYDAGNGANNNSDTPNDAPNKNPRTPLKNRIIIYPNDSSLHHLGALIEQMSCVISPSTGTLHMASNLYVPTIALVSEGDTRRWGTPDARYVVLHTPTISISQSEEDAAIHRTLELLEQTCLSELGTKALNFGL